MVLRKSLSWSVGYFITSGLIKMIAFMAIITYAISQDSLLSNVVFNKKLYDSGTKLYLTMSPGGQVDAYNFTVDILNYLDKRIYIGGDCYSACTFFTRLKDKDNVCATKTAKLHFHAFRHFDKNGRVQLIADKDFQRIKHKYYPKEVLDWLDAQGGFPKNVDDWIVVPATKFFKECKDTLAVRRL